jgi:hypothetical protein
MAQAIGPERAFFYLYEFLPKDGPALQVAIVLILQYFDDFPRESCKWSSEKALLIEDFGSTWVSKNI